MFSDPKYSYISHSEISFFLNILPLNTTVSVHLDLVVLKLLEETGDFTLNYLNYQKLIMLKATRN
jgi:hypothetical protein